MKKIALLTMDQTDGYVISDHLLEKPLLKHGWEVDFISWHKESVNWDQYDVVLIRTTWDYQEHVDKFLNVLQQIENSSAQLENPFSIVQWNINKNYLKELEQKGAAIVPTIWVEEFDYDLVESYFDHFNTKQLIIKPTISAGAENTFWLKKESFQESEKQLKQSLADRQLMVQPFVQAVIDEGEYSLFFFAGKLSHCILKTPKSGDFRVQEEYGSHLQSITPCQELLTAAQKALQSAPKSLLYARVDLVKHDHQFKVMELELIEPSLYFDYDDQSAENFVNALDQWVK